MGLYNLGKIFEPTSIAVVGASETRGSIGQAIMKNLKEGGFEGPVIPVNPKYSQIEHRKAYPTLSDAGEAVDLAVIATPIHTVPEIVEECVQLGVGGAIIISAGGRETGEEGRDLERRIEKTASEGGLRIIGPNCMGILCPEKNLNASFAAHMALPGKTAFISQSGAICSAMLDLSLKIKMGFRYFVSIGSMLDVDFGDLIDYMGHDPGVSSILLYIESLTEVRKFMSAAREVSRVKPIVVLKAGKSEMGARAAASHTGALAGEDSVYEAAFRRAGIARVHNLEDFFDCTEFLAKQSPPAGRQLMIVTNSGGPGVMAADAVAEYGLELMTLKDKTLAQLDALLPAHWSKGNPVDILGDATAKRYARAITCCFDHEKMNGMLVIVNVQAMTDPTEVAKALAEELTKKPFPVFTAMMGGKDVEEGRSILNEAGIPTYETPERAIRSFAVLCDYAKNLEMLQEIPSRFLRHMDVDEEKARRLVDRHKGEDGRFLSETLSKKLLESYGIPVNPTEEAESLDQALRVAKNMGYPLVMKIWSPDVSHKTEAGGVQTDLKDEADLKRAYEKIMTSIRSYDSKAEIRGVTLQPMISEVDTELLIGAKRDNTFGPVILFGMGGILAEILKDRSIALPPLNRTLARMLMERTRVHRILKGYRNIPAADMDLMEGLLVCMAHLLVDFPEIVELDMNPVVVRNGEPLAVDARVLLKSNVPPAPHHLVISPYPEEYESKAKTSGGLSVFIRPIKPEDAPLLLELFDDLSSESRYLRFFSPMKSLSRDMLIRLTQVDYDRHIGLVALDGGEAEEKMLGVARIFIGPDRQEAEFSVAVGDSWQGRGVGRSLLERCLMAAKDYGIKTVYGHVLPENRHMLRLGRELGFDITMKQEEGLFYLKIDLKGDHEE